MAGKKQKTTKTVKKTKMAKQKPLKKKKIVAKKVKKTAKPRVAKITVKAPKENLAEVAKLVTHKEWVAEQEPVKEISPKAPTTPAYSHMFHSVKVEPKPQIKAHLLPTLNSLREKMFIAAGVSVFTLLIGGMWLRVSMEYFQANPTVDNDVTQAVNVLKTGFDQIQQAKDQLIHETAAAVESSQDKQAGIEEANKAYAEEVKKLLDQQSTPEEPVKQ